MMDLMDYKRIAEELRRLVRGKEAEVGEKKTLLNDAAEAIDDLCRKVFSKENQMRVDTPLGAIVVRPSEFGQDYPGFWVALRREGVNQDLALCLVEYTDTEADLEQEGHIITRVYGDGALYEYTHRIVHERIEEFFRTEEA